MKSVCWLLVEITSSEVKYATFWSSGTELISNIVALSASSGPTASATVTTDRNGINGLTGALLFLVCKMGLIDRFGL